MSKLQKTSQSSLSYAERVRRRMRSKDNPTHQSLTLKALATLTGYSFEHNRKVVNDGLPVGSRQYNDALCGVLGLDAEAMWQLACREKVTARFGKSFLAQMPHDVRLVEMWPMLTDGNREKVVQVAAGLLAAQHLETTDQAGVAQLKPTTVEPAPISTKATPTPNDDVLAVYHQAAAPAQVPAPVHKKHAKPPKAAFDSSQPVGDTDSPWMDLEAVRRYLGLATRQSAYSWLRNHSMPRSAGQIRVHRTNLDRVIAGLAPKPLSSFIKKW